MIAAAYTACEAAAAQFTGPAGAHSRGCWPTVLALAAGRTLTDERSILAAQFCLADAARSAEPQADAASNECSQARPGGDALAALDAAIREATAARRKAARLAAEVARLLMLQCPVSISAAELDDCIARVRNVASGLGRCEVPGYWAADSVARLAKVASDYGCALDAFDSEHVESSRWPDAFTDLMRLEDELTGGAR